MKMNQLCCWLFLIFPFVVLGQENASTWRGIEPLVTTKAVVEKSLGKPSSSGFYEFDDQRVLIMYVDTNCEGTPRCECMVPVNTVLFIDIELYSNPLLKNMGIDLAKFHKNQSPNNPAIITYSSKKLGLVYETQDGKVSHIYHYAPESTCAVIEARQKP